ncbi:hypothetical protein [Aquisediminimonas sediminicola]|uniref:hypothetical protein n=1 Tax=Alteraquisediminimonas sediminicola TaxID=2676787 RepID=UPI001C8EBB88|nr:hypothetical protein [Aquisediminimonas sediminicola]
MASQAGANWTNADSFVERADTGTHLVATKVATGSEPASYVFTASGSSKLAGFILRIPGAVFDAIGAASINNMNVVLPAVTMTQDGLALAFVFNSLASTSFSISGWALVVQDNNANTPSIGIFSKKVPAGSTGTVTTTSTSASSGILLGVK